MTTPYEPFETYGAVGDNATDCTPAITAALAAGEKHLWLGAGQNYRFNTKPPALNGIYLHGAGVSNTAMVKAWSSTYYGDAILDFTGSPANGGGAENMSVVANDSTGGSMLRVVSLLGSPASYTAFSNLNFTYAGSANYDRAILIDGSQALTGAQGVRTPKLFNITAFQPTGKPYAIEIINAVSLMGANIWTNGSIRIGGTGHPYGNSTSCTLANVIAGVRLDLDNVAGITVHGQIPTLNVGAGVFNGTYQGVVNVVNNPYAATNRFKVYGSL